MAPRVSSRPVGDGGLLAHSSLQPLCFPQSLSCPVGLVCFWKKGRLGVGLSCPADGPSHLLLHHPGGGVRRAHLPSRAGAGVSSRGQCVPPLPGCRPDRRSLRWRCWGLTHASVALLVLKGAVAPGACVVTAVLLLSHLLEKSRQNWIAMFWRPWSVRTWTLTSTRPCTGGGVPCCATRPRTDRGTCSPADGVARFTGELPALGRGWRSRRGAAES